MMKERKDVLDLETKTVLVMGGAGFMGSWLVDELVERGHRVISVDSLLGGYERNVNKRCKFLRLDLRQKADVMKLMHGVDIVFHLAAYAAEGQSFFSPIGINDINVTPMNNLLVAAVNNNIERFVFTSSMAVYGNQRPPFHEDMPRKPEDPYGVGKAYCEMMLEIFSKMYGFEYNIIRPHNVYGRRQNIADAYRNVLAIWINRIMRGKPPLIYGDGEQTRAFSYIEDVIPPLANAGFYAKCAGEIVNLGSDEAVTINSACDSVLSAMNSRLIPEHVEERPGEVKHAYCTIQKSRQLLGYETRHTLTEGLKKIVDWAKELGQQVPTYTIPLEVTKKIPRVWLEKLM